MNLRRANRQFLIGVVFLLLIVGHEAISVRNTIREQSRFWNRIANVRDRNRVRKREKELREAKENLQQQCSASKDVCGRRKDELVLLQTMESIHSSFNFPSSTMKKDCLALTKVSYHAGTPMDKETIQMHKKEATAFLEKATGFWKTLAATARNVRDKVSDTFGGAASKEKAARDEVGGLNQIFGEGLGMVETTVDDDTLSTGASDVQHLTSIHVVKSLFYGLLNGFFAGMMDDMSDDFNDESCDTTGIKTSFKDLAGKLAGMWDTVVDAWKHVWTDEGRDQLADAVKLTFISLKNMFGAMFQYVVTCRGMKTILFMVGIISVAFALNALIIAMGLVVIPIIIKLAGIILEIVTSVPYLAGLIKQVLAQIKLVVKGACKLDCKRMFIQSFAEVIGFFAQVILMSGDILKLAPKKAGQKFGRFKWNPQFVDDMKLLKGKIGAADDGAKIKPNMFNKGSAGRFGDEAAAAANRVDEVADAAGATNRVDKTAAAANGADEAAGVANGADEAAGVANGADEAAAAAKKDGDALLRNEKSVGADTGGKGTADNPMSWNEGKKFNEDGKFAFDRYSDDVPKEMLREQGNFAGGRFNEVVVMPDKNSEEVITLYRAGNKHKGGKSYLDDAVGGYWTRDPPAGEFAVRSEAAVKMEWNNLDTVYKIDIPVSSLNEKLVMFEGPVGLQGPSSGLHKHLQHQGGGSQIFLDAGQLRGGRVPKAATNVLKSRYYDNGLLQMNGIKVQDIGYRG